VTGVPAEPRPSETPERASATLHRIARSPLGRLAPLVIGLFVLGVVSCFLGDVAIPARVVLGTLLEHAFGAIVPISPCAGTTLSSTECYVYQTIVWTNYVPEVLLGVLVGAALGVSGAALQGTFRNPLADPFLLGLSSGAAFGASLIFVFHLGIQDAQWTLPLFAFAGAMLSGGVVLLAARSPRSSVTTLLLTGVAMSSFFSALLILTLLYNPNGNLQVSFWLLGGLEGATWNQVAIVFSGVLVAGSILALYGRALNLLQLGSDVAQSLGVDARQTRIRVMLLASFVTAVAVAFAGVIGFVGLIAPHVVRRVAGYDYRIVLTGAAVVGAIFVVGSRDLALLFFPGIEVPVGVPMAFVGALFFLYLLYRRPGPAGEGSGW